MSTLETLLLMLLVVDALALAVLVLLQQGKGADVGAAFGSGSASTMFGSAGAASFFTKATVWLSVGFFLISFALAYMAKERATNLDELGLPGLDIEETTTPTATDIPDLDASKPANVASGAAENGAESDASASAPTAQKQTDETLTQESDSVDSDIPEL
ncbi:MAG: preprotein translocase subunit SecG [Gammaproteobacteria bacterium]